MEYKGRLTPANVAFSLITVNVASILLHFVTKQDVWETAVLSVLVGSTYVTSFVWYVSFHFIWVKRFGPGKYWDPRVDFTTMFNERLASFYISESGVITLVIGWSHVLGEHEFLDFAWHAIALTFTTPVIVLLTLEMVMYVLNIEINP